MLKKTSKKYYYKNNMKCVMEEEVELIKKKQETGIITGRHNLLKIFTCTFIHNPKKMYL